MKIWPTATTEFLTDTRSTIRTEQSRHGYRSTLKRFGEFTDGKHLARIEMADCVAFLNRPNSKTGKPLSKNMVAAEKTRLAKFFGWANYKGHTARTPMAGIENVVNTRGGRNVTIHHWLDAEERKALLAACPDTPVGRRDRAMCMVLLYTGLRLDDMAKLRWGSRLGNRIKGVGKNEKPFEVQLLGPVNEALDEWLKEWVVGAGRLPNPEDSIFPRQRIGWTGANHPEATVLCHEEGLEGPGIREAVKRAGARIGVNISTHDMRRTFAGWLEENEVPMEQMAAAMRHDDTSTTRIYLKKHPGRTFDALGGRTMSM